MDKATEQLYREREKRYIDAVQLRVPDRVPTSVHLSYFPARFAGITYRDCYYDFAKWKEAYVRTALWLQPDRCEYFPTQSGRVMEAMDTKTSVWPGHGIGVNSSHQWVEGEYMKAEEYDLFLNDQSDFNIRCLLPRSYGFLAPLAKLPPLESMQMMLPYHVLATPEFANMCEKIAAIAREAVDWQRQIVDMFATLNEVGFPGRTAMAGGIVPYDMISDFLRGMRGAMLDMFRRPEKLERSCQQMCRLMLERIAATPAADGFQPVFMPLHRGEHGFMSLQQFERYYWPYLKAVCLALIEKGYTPDLFFEGDYNSRLEYIAELPRGKAIARFDQVDMAKAKEIVGKTICIAGNMPVSTLQMGTKADVERECRRILDAAAPGGGFMMSPASSLDEVNPENMRVWIDCTKTYGKY